MAKTYDETRTAKRFLRKLSSSPQIASGFESVEAEANPSDSLTMERAQEARAKAVERIKNESGGSLTRSEEDELDQIYLNDGVEAFDRLRNDGEAADLNDDHLDALEAIVETDGSRPALKLSEEDKIDLNDDILDLWKTSATEYFNQITKVASAVGRIDKNGKHQGTGFVIKRGVILTNRHVLQQLASQNSNGEWTFSGDPTIAFNPNPEDNRSREYKIKKQVILAGNQKIVPPLDFNKMDFAVLQCELAAGDFFPDPLTLESAPNRVVTGRPVYSLGYPGKPLPGSYKFEVLLRLFGNKFSIKRFAPGEIDGKVGVMSSDTVKTVFTHDATTLGGNSGSCIVDFGDDGLQVVGLHFAGKRKVQNYAHSIAKLKTFLSALELDWNDPV